MKRLLTPLAALTLSAPLLLCSAPAPADAAPLPVKYPNCAALNKVYKHGVGRAGAKDKTAGKRVTTFTVNNALYTRNAHLDRDKDGIACEKV